EYLEELNSPQKEAVLHEDGPLLVLAGAGSGKTRVLTRRVANLILNHGVRPWKILAVTFTNKATKEMQERLIDLLGDQANQIWVNTFHSLGLKILRRHASELGYQNNFVIYDDQDTLSIIKRIVKELDINDKKFPPKMFKGIIDKSKNECLLPKDLENNSYRNSELVHEVYFNYQKKLMESNAMDFGDLLLNIVELFKKNPTVLENYRDNFDYLLVDEFQDTNKVQYLILKFISQNKANLFAVGDDDQSIYAFRGADIGNILSFEKDYPDSKVIKLEQNYRSTSNILEVAHSVISKNKDRKEKKLWTDSDSGDLIYCYSASDENDEADFIASQIEKKIKQGYSPNDIAIFYRTNAQSRALEEALMSYGVDYKIFGGLKFYDRKEIKDVIAYLKLLLNPSDSQAFLRTINNPPRGIGAKSVLDIQGQAIDIPLWESALNIANNNPKIKKFTDLIGDFTESSQSINLSELVNKIIVDSGYLKRLEDSKDITDESRIENLKELAGIARGMEARYDSPRKCLEAFLDRISLTSGGDNLKDENTASVSLMTLHLAKGLEFPLVFLSGLEDGLLPHARSKDNLKEMQEERRLCYVGITRARKELFITRARKRAMFTSFDSFNSFGNFREISQFAYDMPSELLESIGNDFFEDASAYSDDFSSNIDYKTINKYKVQAYEENKKVKSKKTTPKVMTADQLANVDPAKILTKEEVANLKSGTNIIHPNFGEGSIVEIEGDPINNPFKSKVLIKFNNQEKARKFIIGFANLSLA
ncbi:UNVERIFIED_CONTAM: hypothetical protein GTU68_022216, partial [Idotea baltica]|nr:hypothetical protein [Idotea baltica]